MLEDFDSCYRAVSSRDARFDGWFVTAVTSTGIYCRPSCPALTPRRANVRFYPSAAAAQQAGFRACKRCRPDASPGSPAWQTRADVVARAMRLIADGVVDRDGVAGLAARLGYSARQLERLLTAELGAGPLALARAQRAQTARTLIETTDLPMTAVAFAAGFASIRQFNDVIRAVFAATPSALRARTGATGGRGPSVSLRLAFRRPLDAAALLGHLAARAVAGLEEARDGAYRRALRLPRGVGVVALTPAADHVHALLRLDDTRDLAAAVARCRRLLDLDADPVAIDEALAGDPALAPSVAAGPGRRVPRSVDPLEAAVRAVLAQQVSLRAARTLTARLVERCGEAVDDPDGGLLFAFPTAAALADALADPAGRVGMPAGRRAALLALARAVAGGEVDLDAGAEWVATRRALAALPGVGGWTVELIALRALGDPDAFPASDLALRRGAARLGLPSSPAALAARARAWRPWRGYAAQHLWTTDATERTAA